MSALSRHRPSLRPAGLLAGAVAVVIAAQVWALAGAPDRPAGGPAEGLAGGLAVELPQRREGGPAPVDPVVSAGGDLERIRANISFWSAKVDRNPRDVVSATEWATAEIALARATGDVTPYVRADEILRRATGVDPDGIGHRSLHAAVLLSLHRFAEARRAAEAILAVRPDDPAALSVLGDAALDTGDVETARAAYERLASIAPSAASMIRQAQLAWLTGDSSSAVSLATGAAAAADEEGADPERAAWYRVRLADLQAGSGAPDAAAASYRAALAADPSSFLAQAGLARLAASAGDFDTSIDLLTAAIARVPQPDLLARRSDVYLVRGAPGDEARAADDAASVQAIIALAGAAGSVYDRNSAVFLATRGIDVERAALLAAAELSVRQDVFAWDARGWTLLAVGKPAEADAAMRRALALGTRDARLLLHAGIVAAAVGDDGRARMLLEQGLGLDPGADLLLSQRARQALAVLP